MHMYSTLRVSAITVIMLTIPLSGCLKNTEFVNGDENIDVNENLRINHIQTKGTHNSYHLEPLISPTREYMYSHETLDIQAMNQGVRQFEIDVWWDLRDGLRVYHNQYDSGTTCATLEICLSVLLQWSSNNPSHHTVFIWIEPKDWPEQTAGVTTTVQFTELLGDIESEIDEFWPRNKSIIPQDIQQNHSSLGQAIITEGWPLISESRGKAMFILLATGEMRDLYIQEYFPDGIMFPMFTSVQEAPVEARAFFSLTDPITDQSEIQQLVDDGFIVRTRADSGGQEADDNDNTRLMAALSSGAHSISTDYPAKVEDLDYWVDIPGGNPSRCNPVSAPPTCSSEDIESIHQEIT